MDKKNDKVSRGVRSTAPLDATVGARIAARRMALGLSQAAIGRKVGVSFQQVQKYENGQNRIPASRLHSLAQALGVPIAALFPEQADTADNEELVLFRAMTATPEGRRLASGFARIEDLAVRRAVTQLVEVLARAA
nr:helix-turn-helix domain-containing protein [uncultured Brevundimonas sp.]